MELVVRYMPLPILIGNHVDEFLKKFVDRFHVAYSSMGYRWLLNQDFLPCSRNDFEKF